MALFFVTLKKEIFSIKSFVIGALFVMVSVLAGKYTTSVSIFLNSNGSSDLIDLLFGVYGFLGYLFSSVLFSGLISKELESQTMRYLTPYLSRKTIYLAKYFASLCYFLLILLISLIVLFLFRGAIVFPVYSMLSIIAFFAYIQSLVLLISTIAKNERVSTLINLMLSLAFPIVYGIAYFKNWFILKAVQWFMPYIYLTKTWELIFLLLLTISISFLGISCFKRKEI